MNDQLVPTIPLFSSVRRRDRRTIARLADTIDVPAWKTLAREGDLAAEFFVVLDGVAVASRDGRPVATLGPGDFFGEIGLLAGPRRTATVTAATPMQLVVVGSREFASMLDAFPGVGGRIRGAAERRAGRSSRVAA